MAMGRLLRLVRGGRSFLRVVQDPNRLNEVFDLAEQIADAHDLRDIIAALSRDPGVQRALAERPRLGAIDLDALGRLPVGTLGREFADHMIRNRLDPSALPSRPSPDVESYVLAHTYETHDLWHVLTGFDTSVAGELGLQAFYVAQVPGRIATAIIAAILLNTITSPSGFAERGARMDAIARGWLLGTRAKPMFGIGWSARWSVPLRELRTDLQLDLEGVDALIAAGRSPLAPA